MKRRLLIAVAACTVLGSSGLWLIATLHDRYAGRDIRGSATVEFDPADTAQIVDSQRTTSAPRNDDTAGANRPDHTSGASDDWPTYGHDVQGTRTSILAVRPSRRILWTYRAHSLLEFPPAVADGRVFLETFKGNLVAFDGLTGRVAWRLDSGRCGWSAPAVAAGVVYATFLGHAPCGAPSHDWTGLLIALDATSGRKLWSRSTPATESSPLVYGRRVVIGDWGGHVSAYDTSSGDVAWSTSVGAQVKGSTSTNGGLVFEGTYGGKVYALDARSGRIVWIASGQPRLGGPGRFYSSPAAAFGRVYIGSTDGRIYSYGARDGKLMWSHHTDGYVYASPAVWHSSVIVGSYDHALYSFDAATGDVNWRFHADGPISGSANVVGGIAYISTLIRTTYGIDAATGQMVWRFDDGRYTPVVADSRRIYLVGEGKLMGVRPLRVTPHQP